jgi:hypothetical protein
MKERPILLTGREARATMSGQKSQARRLVHPDFQWLSRLDTANQPDGVTSFYVSSPDGTGLPLRLTHVPAYPGDRLWVRETFALEHLGEDGERVVWKADRAARWLYDGEKQHYLESDYKPARWTPAVQMPLRLSRIMLEVTAVRVQRLQDISEEDAKAEGIRSFSKDGNLLKWWPCDPCDGPLKCAWADLPRAPRDAFQKLWDSINGKSAPWSSNPWTWVVEFKVANVAGGSKEAA